MYKFKILLLYNQEKPFSTKTELSNFKITLTLAKLDIVTIRVASNGSIFSGFISVDIQLITLLLLYNTREMSIGARN